MRPRPSLTSNSPPNKGRIIYWLAVACLSLLIIAGLSCATPHAPHTAKMQIVLPERAGGHDVLTHYDDDPPNVYHLE